MKTSRLSRFCLTGYLFLLAAIAQAQTNYKYQAEIKNINAACFYQIMLPPQIVAKCLDGLDDVRILDEKGLAIPYVMQKDAPVKNGRKFIEFATLPLPVDNDSTALVVKNAFLLSIQRLYLTIKNTTVQRNINLLGSDDGKKWYAISENIPLNGADNTATDSYEQALVFPPSTYHYYKITVSNKNKAPIKILKAGAYTNDPYAGMYQLLPAPVISQKDSNGHSYIKLKFGAVYNIDKITLTVTGPKYFNRKINFQDLDPAVLSKSPADFFNLGRTNDLRIVIENQDNPPLKVTSAKAYQLSQSLLSYLEAGKKYRLTFGDSTAKAPHYDLAFFTDSINKSLKLAGLGPVVYQPGIKKVPAKPWFNFTYLLWGAIAVILLALAFFTYKMANEVKAKNS